VVVDSLKGGRVTARARKEKIGGNGSEKTFEGQAFSVRRRNGVVSRRTSPRSSSRKNLTELGGIFWFNRTKSLWSILKLMMGKKSPRRQAERGT